MTKTKREVKTTENKFTKSQILASKKLSYSRDLINTLLKDDKDYTLKEVETEINKYLERKVI